VDRGAGRNLQGIEQTDEFVGRARIFAPAPTRTKGFFAVCSIPCSFGQNSGWAWPLVLLAGGRKFDGPFEFHFRFQKVNGEVQSTGPGRPLRAQ